MVQKDKKLCQIIVFACPYDGRLNTKELEKMEHYQDLAQELRKIWKLKVKVIPLGIVAQGTTPITLGNWIKEIDTETQITQLQKTVFLHTAQILRKVLEV